MSETDNGTGYRSPDDIQADIEQQREHLAETVDQLAHKLDVKAQGKAKVEDLKNRVTTDDGKPRPEVVAGAAAVFAVFVVLVWWRRRS
jgi:hypothetical protein